MSLFSKRWVAKALGAFVLAIGMTSSVLGGAVSATQTPPAKNEDIEKAGAALMKGNADECLKLLQEAVKKNPTLPPAKLMMARLCFQTRELQAQARQFLEQTAVENPDHPAVYLTNAGIAMNDNRLIETILNSEKALATAAADRWTAEQKKEFQIAARTNLATAYERRGDWASARTQLASMLELDKNGKNRSRLATALFFLDKPDEALVELNQASKEDPLIESPNVQMARLWTNKGDSKNAREWLDKAIKAEPNSLRVHLAYADWLLQQNEVEQAKIHADAAEKIDPNSMDVQKLRGLIARIQKDFGTAEKIFRRVFNETPSDFFGSNQLALVLLDQNDAAARNKGLQQAQLNYQANQRNAEALATLGYAMFRVNNVDEALKVMQAAVQGTGGQLSADGAYYLALVLNERDKGEEAKQILDGALKSRGLFIYRKEAQTLFDRLAKEKPATPKPESPAVPKAKQ